MSTIYRFKSSWTGDILEIKDPIVIERDPHGALLKAVWFDDKGKKQTIEWDPKTQAYITREEDASPKSSR